MKMPNVKMQDVEMLSTKIDGMKQLLTCSVIWCSTLCWSCTLESNVFLLYSKFMSSRL